MNLRQDPKAQQQMQALSSRLRNKFGVDSQKLVSNVRASPEGKKGISRLFGF
jgi:hypothetical protein